MSFKTNAIKVSSLALILTSAYAGSKFSEYNLQHEINAKLLTEMDYLSSRARFKWNKSHDEIKAKFENLAEYVNFIENSHDQIIENKLLNEKKALNEAFETAIEKKTRELEMEAHNFQSYISEKIKAAEDSISKVETQLNSYLFEKEKVKFLENISLLIIEDKIEGQFDNCFSLKTLKNEYKSLLPTVRQYYTIDYTKISIFSYYFSLLLSRLMFSEAPMQKFDILDELNYSVETGDLHRSLFLFNNLKGWPRLLLKDWAEKCRLRLEFIQKIKGQLYLNKI